MSSLPNHRPKRKPRRGVALYVTVMGVAMIVAVAGLGAITAGRIRLQRIAGCQQLVEARTLAASAVENMLVVLNSDPDWRTTYQNNTEYPASPISLGGGTFTWKLIDEDGLLDDDPADPVWLCGIGRVGPAVWTERVLLEPVDEPLSCLEVSLHSGTSIVCVDATVQGDQTLSANDEVTATSSAIYPDVEAFTISGKKYHGSKTAGISPRTMPDTSTVFDDYLQNGTTIDYSSLSPTPDGRAIEEVLLGPASNPYGSGETNAEGIYVIDCQQGILHIRNCRIVGTLVVLNSAFESSVGGAIQWEPGAAAFPSLLVQSSAPFSFNFDDTLLDEAALGVNFNPPGTPYQGSENTLTTDTYPSVIGGLVYAVGGIDIASLASTATFNGVVIAGQSIGLRESSRLNYDSVFFNNPPPGFRTDGGMKVVPGTWCRGSGNY